MKKFRTPYLSIILTMIILLSSCNKFESLEFDSSGRELAQKQLQGYKFNKENLTKEEQNTEIMEYCQAQNNTAIDFPVYLYQLNDNTTEDNNTVTIESGVFDEIDLLILENFGTNIQTQGFDYAIGVLQNDILALNPNSDELESYNALVNSFILANSLDPNLFSFQTRDLDCVIATIAFVAAAASLATLEVGTGGVATAAVVIGYIAASTAWVSACHPNNDNDER